ncbi:MAG: peroxiredoxin [Gammaproteobacteria bacterium]|nr:peroxiredoxin [Gammaproteobacteria bacterium]
MIKLNDKMPNGELQQLISTSSTTHTSAELFNDKKVVLFAVPGAFTPTCSNSHLPGYIMLAEQIKAKGVEAIICLSVNDAFVMNAWGEAHNVNKDNIMMLADGDGAFTQALGLSTETGSFGGLRSQRYSMLITNGVVTKLNIEQPKSFNVSDAQTMLDAL